MANTSMKSMRLPEDLQNQVRDYMMSTQTNLDLQKELDEFLGMISPSMRLEVTRKIFSEALSKASLFKGNNEIQNFLMKDIKLILS
jgi:hypothetical protein